MPAHPLIAEQIDDVKATLHPIVNLRLLGKVERWDEYWAQPDLDHQLAARQAA